MLLDPALRSRLERLNLVSHQRIQSQWAGRHSSRAKGESLDFADHREYVPGDDFRRIDHDLWARLGVLLIRRFEAEEELPIRIVVDVSRSMDFESKLETARLLTGVVAYMGLAGGDRVSLYSVPGVGDRAMDRGPVGRHLSAWPLLEGWIETRMAGNSLDLAAVLRTVAAGERTKGATVLISDLLDQRWERALDGLVTGAGGIVLHVLGRSELEPELAGDLRLVDAETGNQVEMSTSEATLRRYRATLEGFVESASIRARRSGLDYLLVPATEDAPEQVLAALVRAGAIR